MHYIKKSTINLLRYTCIFFRVNYNFENTISNQYYSFDLYSQLYYIYDNNIVSRLSTVDSLSLGFYPFIYFDVNICIPNTYIYNMFGAVRGGGSSGWVRVASVREWVAEMKTFMYFTTMRLYRCIIVYTELLVSTEYLLYVMWNISLKFQYQP